MKVNIWILVLVPIGLIAASYFVTKIVLDKKRDKSRDEEIEEEAQKRGSILCETTGPDVNGDYHKRCWTSSAQKS